MSQVQFDSDYAQRQLQRSQHPIRRFVKRFYLLNVLKYVLGPTVDFGCGAGQLLARLPAGSLGLELNPHLVEALQAKGLNARLYDPETDRLYFHDVPEDQFSTLIMSHVLEHFDDAVDGLKRILRSCERLGIKRIIVIVPGKRGFAFDSTHKTFVNHTYLEEHQLLHYGFYSMTHFSYFPVNWREMGNVFTFHEFIFIYDRI